MTAVAINGKDQILLEASKTGDFIKGWEALAEGADPSVADEEHKCTPLHFSAKEGDLRLCKALVASGANINARDKFGQTPLHRAAFWGNFAVVKYLVEAGADYTLADFTSQLPEELAFYQSHLHIYKYITQLKVELKRKEIRKQEQEKMIQKNLKRQKKNQKRLEEAEKKFGDKIRNIEAQMSSMEAELNRLLSLSEEHLTKKTRARAQKLAKHIAVQQDKASKLASQLREIQDSCSEQQLSSGVPIDDKGAQWIRLINNDKRGFRNSVTSSIFSDTDEEATPGAISWKNWD